MMRLWDPDFACIKSRTWLIGSTRPKLAKREFVGDQTTQKLVERAWGGRKVEVRRVSRDIDNWKNTILPSLLQRSERRRAEDSSSNTNSDFYSQQQQQRLPMKADNRAGTPEEKRMTALDPGIGSDGGDDDNDDASAPSLSSANHSDSEGGEMQMLKVSSASLESLTSEISEDQKQNNSILAVLERLPQF